MVVDVEHQQLLPARRVLLIDLDAAQPYRRAILAMIVKEFRELARDRRTLAMLIALPLLFLVIFGYAANFSVTSTKAALSVLTRRSSRPSFRRSSK